jgi:hypothetical protein
MLSIRFKLIIFSNILFIVFLAGCTSSSSPVTPSEETKPIQATNTRQPAEITKTSLPTQTQHSQPIETIIPTKSNSRTSIIIALPPEDTIIADVLTVEVTGNPGAFRFSVEIQSPDLGCNQYADWWEVVDEDGNLLYRRILVHSHVDEQPFIRSGGPIAIDADQVVWVRAHMNSTGYGGSALKGSVQGGFFLSELSPDFAPDLADTPPLPDGCAF